MAEGSRVAKRLPDAAAPSPPLQHCAASTPSATPTARQRRHPDHGHSRVAGHPLHFVADLHQPRVNVAFIEAVEHVGVAELHNHTRGVKGGKQGNLNGSDLSGRGSRDGQDNERRPEGDCQ